MRGSEVFQKVSQSSESDFCSPCSAAPSPCCRARFVTSRKLRPLPPLSSPAIFKARGLMAQLFLRLCWARSLMLATLRSEYAGKWLSRFAPRMSFEFVIMEAREANELPAEGFDVKFVDRAVSRTVVEISQSRLACSRFSRIWLARPCQRSDGASLLDKDVTKKQSMW